MQFTPQQLTGGPRYQHQVRIGNWSEDLELEDTKLKDYLAKKESGTLIVTAKQQQLGECLAPAELSAAPDGGLHFGMQVMVQNHQSKGFLSANPYDTVPKVAEAMILTTASSSEPSARSVFELERVSADDGYDDDVVHYGQKFRLKLHPFSKMQAAGYMHSELVTVLAAAKFSRHQEVTALLQPTGETKWEMLCPDVNERFETDGAPVPAGSPLVLRHVQTGSFLASDEIPYKNLFGTENEVHCFPYYSLNKTQNLTGEKKGDITGDYALRKHGLPNVWSVLTADTQAA